ncbi:phage gp6-like head-tail connector protein [Actinacidiphila glaucinigra]|uniref:phage gp6-like head-tail connector protein n=1 Tax=Actinacidiphila glaucinigra TaxID=235986 RepID=UPI002E329E2D|nr:phage gp6-like head-tail connector protein [Actinacidiphila glaucinigra]
MAGVYGSLAALKERLTVEASDTSRDSLLNSALAAASRGIDRATGRRFWLDETPVQRVYNPAGRVVCEPDGELLLVDDIGSADGLVVETGRGASWTAITSYETGPDNALADGDAITGLLLVAGTWGTATQRVRITARFGWPAVPDDITEAALIQAARLYRRKDSPEGVMGNAEWGVVRLSRRDPDVWNLIEPYVLPGFA